MDAAILSLVLKYSIMHDLDPRLVNAVIQVESGYNPKAIGPVGELGLMQLRPHLYPEYSIHDLFTPEVNIKLGVQHLAKHLKRCKHQGTVAIVCYNYGITGGNKLRNPAQVKYYKKVMGAYENAFQTRN